MRLHFLLCKTVFKILYSQVLVQLHASAPSIRVRLWPSRFTDGKAADDHSLLGFYLFGLTPSATSHEVKQLAQKEKTKVRAALLATLRAFENNIQHNSRYYDTVDTFVSVSVINSSQLPSTVVLDAHRWSDNGVDGWIVTPKSQTKTMWILIVLTSSCPTARRHRHLC